MTTRTGSKRTASRSKSHRRASTDTGKAKTRLRRAGNAGRTKTAGKKVTPARRGLPKGGATKRQTATSTRSTRTKTSGVAGSTAKKGVVRKTVKKTTDSKKASQFSMPLTATSQDPIQFREEKPLPKTHLSAKELREFRDLLIRKRAELVGDVQGLTDEALSRKGRGNGEQSTMPIHMADLGSDNWEQEFTLGLLANERTLVREIDEALDRIENKTYGTCLATHKKISKARLRAKPWAKYCIEYARAREEGRAI